MKIIGGNNMHVGAINGLTFTHRSHRTSPGDDNGKLVRYSDPQPPVEQSGEINGAKAMMYLLMSAPILTTLPPALESCNKEITYNINCCCDTCPNSAYHKQHPSSLLQQLPPLWRPSRNC